MNTDFRKKNDARVTSYAAATWKKAGRNLSLTNETFTFGKANRPQTPLHGIINGDFGEEAGAALQQNSIIEFGFTFDKQKTTKSINFKTDISLFSYNYTNKIKRILLSGTSISYPVNAGNISIYGYDMKLLLYPKWDWIHFETMFSRFSSSDYSLFPSHPPLVLNQHAYIKNRYFNVLIKMRAESKKYIARIFN